MIRSEDVQQFIDQRDPYIEGLVLTINRIKERERPGLRRLLLHVVDKIHLGKEEIIGVVAAMGPGLARDTVDAARGRFRDLSVSLRRRRFGRLKAGTA